MIIRKLNPRTRRGHAIRVVIILAAIRKRNQQKVKP